MPCIVASFTDAWIETLDFNDLKQYVEVASFTDAWIETRACRVHETRKMASHLLQMRGLKLWKMQRIWKRKKSHLLQMRGLKPYYSTPKS